MVGIGLSQASKWTGDFKEASVFLVVFCRSRKPAISFYYEAASRLDCASLKIVIMHTLKNGPKTSENKREFNY